METAQPSAASHRKLQLRAKYLGLTYENISKAAGVSGVTVWKFLNGHSVWPDKQDAILSVLKMRRVEDFEPLEDDRDFLNTINDAGVKFSTHYEPTRDIWAIVQETDFCSQEIAQVPWIRNEKLAKFFVRSLSAAVK